jgi:carnitine O-acetyltransferase
MCTWERARNTRKRPTAQTVAECRSALKAASPHSNLWPALLSSMFRLSSSLVRTNRVSTMATRGIKTTAPRKSSVPAGYNEDASAGPMLRYEASLPRLPVPPLEQTCARYLESVKPHLTDSEFSKTSEVVKSFLSSPLSRDLQERLKLRESDTSIRNWLADWWNDAAYMAYRDPVVV